MGYTPAFDGLRAIAVFAVVAFHAGSPFAKSGFIGVDMFFVLSGFLITSILKAEHERTGAISLRSFYWRRALRLYPTMLVLLIVFVSIAPTDAARWVHASLVATYLSDYSIAFFQEPAVLKHTWSLSVEEHFYIALPLLLPAILRHRSPVRLLIMLYAASTLWRALNAYHFGWDLTYFRFDTRLSGLVLGCALAFVVERERVSPWVAVAAAAAFASLLALATHRTFAGLTVMPSGAELASAALVLFAARECPALLSQPWLAYIGRLSYGIYLWHFPIVLYLHDMHANWPLKLAVSGTASIALAALTYHFVDIPLRRFRHTSVAATGRSPTRRGIVVPQGDAATSA